jgi:hypothetical protein
MSEREPDQIPAGGDAGDEPHDVLAAEEFPGPSRNAAIHEQGPIELPANPDGDEPAHDVLAAEEFAMPAPRHHGNVSVASEPAPGPSRAPLVAGLAAALAGAVVVLLRRRAAKRSRPPGA